MIREHAERMRTLSNDYNLPLSGLMELYSHKQTQYIKRDLNNNKDVKDLLGANAYGERALSVMEGVAVRKGYDGLEKIANEYKLG